MAFNMAYFKKLEEERRKDPNYVPKINNVTNENAEEGTGYFKFHKNSNFKKNPHYFLGEELLVPRMGNTDTQRGNMFASHLAQLVHLKNPEFPKVFTNFENQVGEYSVAYKRADEDFEVLAKIEKNKFNHTLIVRYLDSGVYDVINFSKSCQITEDYGYAIHDCIPNVKVGDTVKRDSFIYKSDNYDDDGNFSYGVNLKSVFLTYKNLTYEDGIVLSESAAKKLTSYKTEKTMFSVNGNDVLLNLYGNENLYKSFPKVGDYVDSKILVASRRKDKRTSLFSFQESRMRQVDPSLDEIIYTAGGLVTDITIYSNIPLSEMKKKTDVFNQEVYSELYKQQMYWKTLAEELEKIIPCKVLTEKEEKEERSEFSINVKHPIAKENNPNKYTDNLAYYWKLSHENIDENIAWRFDGKSFENFKMEFTILKEAPLTPGSKITGRYGNKGIISKIEKDENMPITVDGQRAEVCLNSLGVLNRCNPGQIIEQHINFMSDHVLRQIKETDDVLEKQDIFLEYLQLLNKKEYDYFYLEFMLMSKSKKEEFFADVEEKGIFIHQPPIFENTTEEEFLKILESHPEWNEPYKFVGIEQPLVMGDIYFIRLKHDSSNKSSMRSAANLNVRNLPAKSTLKKEKKVLYSSTPIRLGEMEVANLMLTKEPELVEKLLKSYSTNENAREKMIMELLDPGKDNEGRSRNAFNMEISIKPEDYPSISKEILEKYFNVLGYSIVENIE